MNPSPPQRPSPSVLNLPVGDVRLAATDRDDTVVRVRPSDVTEPDQQAAKQTRVELADGTAGDQGAQAARSRDVRHARVDRRDHRTAVRLEAAGGPAVAAVRSTGRLGECRVKTATGDVALDEAGPLEVSTAAGAVAVQQVAGDAEVTTGTGRVRLDTIDGAAVIKNSNGDTTVGDVTGDLRVKAANGNIAVGRAGADVTAKTANGDVRIGEVAAARSRSDRPARSRSASGRAPRPGSTCSPGSARAQRARRRRLPVVVRLDRRGPCPHSAGDIVIRRAAPGLLARGATAREPGTARPAIWASGCASPSATQVVLDGIDLTVAEGTVFALLGPNGAGKTTTVHILSTLIPPTAARSASPVTTWPTIPTPSAPRSA